MNGRAVVINKKDGTVTLSNMVDDESKANQRLMLVEINHGTVFFGTTTKGEKCNNKHFSGVVYRNGEPKKTIVSDDCYY